MTRKPTLGLALVVRDEEGNLPRLLENIEGHFDEVVLVDTGSKDRTVELFCDWAARQENLRWKNASFQWVDDFAAARAYADSLCTSDVLCWADADDTIRGVENLRAVAEQMPEEVVAVIAGYDYAQQPDGTCCCYLRRERLVRRGAGQWIGAVHEAQVFQGAVQHLAPEVAEWVHHKTPDSAPASSKRNRRILRKWLAREPDNPRVLQYLGTENAVAGKHTSAARYFRRYLRLKTGWDEERAQVHRKLATTYLALGQPARARDVALEALGVLPQWPDSALTLAQAHYELGEPAKAVYWARQCLELGAPDTLLIINPLDYTVEPRVVLAASLPQLGELDQAVAEAEAGLAIFQGHPILQRLYRTLRSDQKREATASTVVGMARLLAEHDEQLKALRLLEQNVPFYCIDHPAVVSLRSALRERVQPLLTGEGQEEHYETATELGIPDLAVVEQLPRAHFLAAGLKEQLKEAA